jgi:Flp pilus assembly protein TadG
MGRKNRQARAGRRGQALVMVTLSLPLMLGLIGLVVDVGWAYWRKEAGKAAADSAALAGATAAYIAADQKCGSGVSCQSDTACQSVSGTTHDTVLMACLWAAQNGFTNGGNNGRQTVSVAANTTASPISGTKPEYWIQVTVSERNPLSFLAILGSTWSTVSSQSTAGSFAQGGGCVYVLDPNKSGAFTQTNGTLSVGCNIYVNSSDSKAFTMTDGTINLNDTSYLKIHGGDTISNGTINPVGDMQINQPTVTDPFAGMTPPTPSLPALPNPGSGTPGTIPAGTYSSISINGGTWTLGSGTFIITGATSKLTVEL